MIKKSILIGITLSIALISIVFMISNRTLLKTNDKEQDYIVRATALGGRIKVFGVTTRNIVNQQRNKYGSLPTATAALGRTISATSMMGSMQESGESITVNIRGDGPIGKITVSANTNGLTEGFLDYPKTDLKLNDKGKLDVSGAIGKGNIEIIKHKKNDEKVNVSFPIVSGELGEDFTYYFAKKEHIPSSVALGVLVDTDFSVIESGGFIIQILQDITNDEVSEIENKLNSMKPVTTLLSNGKSIEKILEDLVGPLELIERKYINLES